MSKLRLREWVKNLLIVALSLSALWLLTLTPLYIGSPLEQRVTELFSTAEPDGSASVSTTAVVRPAAIAVVNSDGRYGAQYDSDAVDTAFDSLGSLLGVALNTDNTPFSTTESRWRTALQQPGIYFDFSGAVPFSSLSGWLQSGQINAALTANVRRLALSYGNGNDDVWLFWQDPDTGLFYACVTTIDRPLLDSALSSWLPNSAFFAFEEDAYAACDPYTFITSTPSPAVYAVSTPLSAVNAGAVEQVLDALSYSVGSGSSYAISGGTRYTDGNNTFQLTDSGELSYHAADSPNYMVSGREDGPTVTECIEATHQIATDTLGLLCGDAQLYLISAQQEDDALVITYGYRLNGAPVFLYDEGWAAQFVVTGDFISAFTLYFRCYTATSTTTLLLPELQAAAAMSALGTEQSELLLSYRDNGEAAITAGWVAN